MSAESNPHESSQVEIDPRGWTEGPRRNPIVAVQGGWPFLLLVMVLVAAGAYVYASRQPSVYAASARVFLNSGGDSGSSDAMRLISTQAQIAVSAPVLEQVGKKLNLPVDEVGGRLRAEPSDQGDFFTISGTGGTPSAAAGLVSAAEASYQQVLSGQQTQRRAALLDDLVEERANVQSQHDQAAAKLAAKPGDTRLRAREDILAGQLRALSEREADALVGATIGGSPVQLVEEPQDPTSPVAPKPSWIAAVGALLGLVLAASFVWWRSDWFVVARRASVAATAIGAPLLGEVGHGQRHRADRGDALASAAAVTGPDATEAALAIDVAGGKEFKVLLLACPRPADLAPSVVLRLSLALADRNRRVVLVDADQREARLTSALKAAGLLADEPSEPDDESPGRPQRLLLPEADRDEAWLEFVSMGPSQPRRRQSLSVAAWLTGTRESQDLVVLVSPPLTTASEAEWLAAATDAVVVVVRKGTPLVVLDQARARLDRFGRRVLGVVFDVVPQAHGSTRPPWRLPWPRRRHRPSDTAAAPTGRLSLWRASR